MNVATAITENNIVKKVSQMVSYLPLQFCLPCWPGSLFTCVSALPVGLCAWKLTHVHPRLTSVISEYLKNILRLKSAKYLRT